MSWDLQQVCYSTISFVEEQKMKSVFLGECKSNKSGAESLMDSVKTIFDNLVIENDLNNKLVSFSTK